MKNIIIQSNTKPSKEVNKKAEQFLKKFKPLEGGHGIPSLLLFDKKPEAFYLICHLDSNTIVQNSDLDAVLDPEESEDYKLNRNIYTDNYAYNQMKEHALKGRSFEDMVMEYDLSYRDSKPLKVFGGQHRITAIQEALNKNVNVFHGVRVYFCLNTEQKLDIALANNTAITTPSELLDRIREEELGPDLRNWSQNVGILSAGQNFADKRSPEGIPTVRIMRTLLVNFYLGKEARNDDFHTPRVCSSGPGLDKDYRKLRDKIDWSDKALMEMGSQFAKLHKTQRERVLGRSKYRYNEFANKAIHPCVTASWAYAAGFFQHDRSALNKHYALSDLGIIDPLNAKALLDARLKNDPDRYRGLGSRINDVELGRMFMVFFVHAKKTTGAGISLKLANGAIKTYAAKKAKRDAEKLERDAEKELANI
ncbi:MAG TPA: hypothetical protein ACFYD2_01675 [Candidatus Avalokitesvara rifleensis]|uniref:hypothetical protein n=1 Tax=Candidatus Avalokitesvara rifleensis TaxID=3367620 RepID=UPI004028C7F8